MLINLAKDYCCYFPNEPPEWSSSLLDIYVIYDVKSDKHLTSTSPRNEPVRLINPTRRVHNGSRLIVELYSNINRFNNIQGFPCILFFFWWSKPWHKLLRRGNTFEWSEIFNIYFMSLNNYFVVFYILITPSLIRVDQYFLKQCRTFFSGFWY